MALNTLNVLYIEDPLTLSEAAEETLEGLFHECIHADSFLESVGALKNVQLDFIVANLASPELEAAKFIRLVKSKIPDFPVVGIGALEEEEQKAVGVDRLIPSPEPRKLLEAVKGLEESALELAKSRNRLKRKLERSLGADEAIDVYFRKTVAELRKYDREIPEEKKMDHSIMRPFLATAYNNLKALDHRLEDDRLKEARIKLERAEKIKRDFTAKSTSTIQESYGVIYLAVQVPYVALSDRFDTLRETIFRLSGEHQMLERKVQALKQKLQPMNEGDEGYAALSEAVKKLNRRDVDTIHALNAKREEIEKVQEEMDAFSEKYFDAFETAYRIRVDSLKEEIADTLNTLCYRFDKELWHRARHSPPIRTFLKEARVQGLFSSKTYMKYYAGKIDEAIAGKQLLRITRYMEEYSNRNKIRFALLSTEQESLRKNKEALEKIDRSVKVYGFTNPEQAIDKHRVYDYDFLLLDYDLGRENGFDVLEEFYRRYKKHRPETTVCMRMPRNLHHRYGNYLEEYQVKYLYDTSLPAAELQEKVMEIL